MTNIANWKITIFNGKIHYSWSFFNSYVKLPEGNCCLVEPHMNKATGFFALKRDSKMNHLGLWELFLRPAPGHVTGDVAALSSHDMPKKKTWVPVTYICDISGVGIADTAERNGNGFKHQTAAKKNRWVWSNGGWLIFEGEKEKNAGWPSSSPIKNTHVMGIAHFQHPYFSDMSLQCQEHLPKKESGRFPTWQSQRKDPMIGSAGFTSLTLYIFFRCVGRLCFSTQRMWSIVVKIYHYHLPHQPLKSHQNVGLVGGFNWKIYDFVRLDHPNSVGLSIKFIKIPWFQSPPTSRGFHKVNGLV